MKPVLNPVMQAWGATPPSLVPVSEEALDKALKFYRDMNKLEVDFTQKKEIKSMNLTMESQGHLILLRPEKTVIWEIKKPSAVKVTLNPVSVTIESNGDRQVFKQSDAASNDGEGTQSIAALMAWLNLDAHQLFSEYKITQTGVNAYRFEPLVPKKVPFKTVEMKLDHQALKRITIAEVSGDQLEISFAKPTLTRVTVKKK
jgi:hypothetical protein